MASNHGRHSAMRRDMQRTISLVASLVALASCKRDAVPTPGVLSATEIECVLPPNEPLVADPVVGGYGSRDFTFRGPDWCHRALEIFMAKRPGYRTAAIIPLEHVIEQVRGVDGEAGTQRLIVLDTPGRGPWPRNYEVKVIVSACTPTSPVDSCLASVTDATWLPVSSVWAPITERRPEQPGQTTRIMMLARTNEKLTRDTYEPTE